MFAILSAAVAPGIALLSYFYLRDKYEAEPIGLVIRIFIIGAVLVLPIMVIEYVLQNQNLLVHSWEKSFLLAGFLEEFVEWAVLYLIVFENTEFTERYDGIVYGVSVSLGFATVENIFYLFTYGIHQAFLRALLPVSSHALFGVIMGYYIGKAKFSSGRTRQKYIAFSLISVAALHGVYDYILSVFHHWAYLIVPFMIYLWFSSLRKVKLAHLEQKRAG